MVAVSLKKKIFYLLLKRKLHWSGWEFPKGGIEPKETKLETLKREINEETGLKIMNIKKFNVSGKYNYEKLLQDRKGFIGQTYSLYAVQLKFGKVKLDEKEHFAYKWMNFDDAVEKLTWPNQKRCLALVNNWLVGSSKKFRTFITESGTTIYLGRDANNNEELIKFVKSEDNIFHTTKPGSPFVKIKEHASEKDLKIAAILCAKFSHAFRKKEKYVL